MLGRRPAVSARVSAFAVESDEPLGTDTTNLQGEFEIRAAPDPFGSPPSARLHVAIGEAPAFVSEPVRADEWAWIHATWSVDVGGRVVDGETGLGISEALVEVGEASATTASDGTFELGTLRLGDELVLTVRRKGYVPVRHESPLVVGPRAERTVVLERGLAFRVRAVDADTLQPIAGVSVHDRYGETAMGPDGEVELSLADERVSFALRHADRADVSVQGTVDEASRSEVLVVRLHRLGTITGTVTDEAGQPVPDAAVSVSRAILPTVELLGGTWPELEALRWCTGDRGPHPAHTDAAGAFALPLGPSTVPFEVECSARGHVAARAGPFTLEESGRQLTADFVLRAAGAIEARVLRGGTPWADGELHYEHEAGDRGTFTQAADGAFLAESISPGRVRLWITAGGAELGDPLSVDVRAGETRRCTIELPAAPATTMIRGHALDPLGRPAVGLGVWAVHENRERDVAAGVRSEASGAFELEVPAEGTFEVRLIDFPERASLTGVAPGTDDLELFAPFTGRAHLRLVDAATGEALGLTGPLLGAYEVAWRESGEPLYRLALYPTESFGTVELAVTHEHAAGRVDVAIHLARQGYGRAEARDVPVTPLGSEPRVVTLELERGVDCTLRLAPPMDPTVQARQLIVLLRSDQLDAFDGPYPEGSPLATVTYNGFHMRRTDPLLLSQVLGVDREGRAVVRALAPGRYFLRSFPDTLRFDPEIVELPTGDSAVEVDVAWSER